MHIRHVVRKTFEVIDPDTGVASVEKRLLENSFLVVRDKSVFLGLLTPADIVESPHKLAIDCLRHKPHVDSGQEIESVLKLMKESRNSVLPVFKGDGFIGVVTQDEIMDYLLEYRNDLEQEVRERTAELSKVNVRLRAEITERKRAEEETKQLKEYLQLQVERMPIGLIVWDTEFHVQSWNPAAEKIFGFIAEEAIRKHPYDLIVPKGAQPHVDDIWRRLLEGDTTAHSVNENITKDGRTIICQWSNTPLKKADGTVVGVLSMVQDITERKQAEEKLKLYGEIFLNSNKGIAIIDPQGFYLEQNSSHRALIGYSYEELQGKTPALHLGDETFSSIQKEISEKGVVPP